MSTAPTDAPRPAGREANRGRLDDGSLDDGSLVRNGTDDLGSGEATDLVAPPRRGRAALFVAVPVLLVLAVFVAVLATREPSTDRIADTPLLGRRAPAIVGTTLDGKAFSLDDLHGRWVVVNFFATWCVPCVQEHPELLSFQRRHEQVGDASVVSVVAGDEPDTVRAFFDKNGGDWPVLSVDTGKVALEYGMVKVPESYLVDPDGIVQAKIIGGVTSTGLDRLIGRLSGAGAGDSSRGESSGEPDAGDGEGAGG